MINRYTISSMTSKNRISQHFIFYQDSKKIKFSHKITVNEYNLTNFHYEYNHEIPIN